MVFASPARAALYPNSFVAIWATCRPWNRAVSSSCGRCASGRSCCRSACRFQRWSRR